MFKNHKKILFLLIIIGLIFVSSNVAFAQGDNETDIAIEDNQLAPITEEDSIDNALNDNDLSTANDDGISS